MGLQRFPRCFRTPLNQAQFAGAAIFLSSNASSFVNGHNLYVDGGITSVP
jgi:gluconate 5-dehydrogenase